jgi:hypothetical protein
MIRRNKKMPNWVFNTLRIRKKDLDKVLDENNEVDFNILMPMPEELKRTISGGNIRKCMAYSYLEEHTLKDFKNSGYWDEAKGLDGINGRSGKQDILNALEERIGKNPQMYNDEAHYEERKNENGCMGTYLVKEDYGHTIKEIGDHYLALREKYGVCDWYAWSNRSWGTKWNACDTYVENMDKIGSYGDNDIVAVSFNTPWCVPGGWLQTLAEKAPFHLVWEEEQGFRGIMENNNPEAELTDTELPEIQYEENEEGDYVRAEDEYGENWTDYLFDEKFSDISPEVFERWDNIRQDEMEL